MTKLQTADPTRIQIQYVCVCSAMAHRRVQRLLRHVQSEGKKGDGDCADVKRCATAACEQPSPPCIASLLLKGQAGVVTGAASGIGMMVASGIACVASSPCGRIHREGDRTVARFSWCECRGCRCQRRCE